MKIARISLKNFRSIKDEVIAFPESGILALVGPNNAGKSNVLRAIENVLGDSWFSGERAELSDYFMRDKENIIKIDINFDDGKSVSFSSDEKWPKYFGPSGSKMPFSSSVKDDFPCTYLAANRDLAKSTQFKSYELMGKIAKAFNDKVSQATKEALNEKFKEVMNLLDGVEEFRGFKNDFSKYFDELQSNSPYRLKVDFKAFSPLNYFKTINILANDSSVNRDFDIEPIELGEGNKSLMLFALIRSYAKNFKNDAEGILAIEEPEIYLHPQARRHLYHLFKEIVKESNIQIVYTTHSPDLLSVEEFSSIGLVSKDSTEGTKIRIVTEQDLVDFSTVTGVPQQKVSLSNVKEYYATTSDAKLNEGFFAKHLILVEGDTEELCLPLLLERMGLNYFSSGISIIGVEGKNQIPKYWRLFKSLGIKLSVVFDSDSQGNENLASCFGCSTEEFIFDNGIKMIRTREQNLYVFKQDFETALKLDFNNDSRWDDFEKEAVMEIKPIMKNGKPDQQKGQVARYVVRRMLSEFPGYKPIFLQDFFKEISPSDEYLDAIRLEEIVF